MSIKSRVLKTEYKPNCYILCSFAHRDPHETLGEYLVKANMSFLYDTGDVAAEWEPEHGPIQIWNKCDKDSEGAREHYYYDFVDYSPMNWSQIAVSRHELPQAANNGDYDYIFQVLKDWAEGK